MSDELKALAEQIKKAKKVRKKDLTDWVDRLEELAFYCEEGLDD